MNTAWQVIEQLVRDNAKHRKGFRLADVSRDHILSSARDELTELQQAPYDITELGDLVSILIHYAIKNGWTQEALEQAMLDKLKIRFATA